MTKKKSVAIDEKLHAAVKKLADRRGAKLHRVVEIALTAYLAEEKAA